MNDKISRSCYHYQYPPVKYETDLKKQVYWNFFAISGKMLDSPWNSFKKVGFIDLYLYLFLFTQEC